MQKVDRVKGMNTSKLDHVLEVPVDDDVGSSDGSEGRVDARNGWEESPPLEKSVELFDGEPCVACDAAHDHGVDGVVAGNVRRRVPLVMTTCLP